MRALRATAEAMRAWPTEIVDRERAPVTSNVRASKLVGRRGQDGRRCFTEKCPTKLVLVPQLRHHQAVVGAGLKRDGTCRSGVQCPTSWDRSGRTGHVVLSSISRQISTSPRSPVLPDSHGQNLPAGGHGSPAGRKRIPAGGGDPFSHRGRKDPRQPWGVMPGPSTGRDGPGNWDGTEVAYRLPAEPVDSSEATRGGTSGPAGTTKSGPAVTVPSHLT